MVESATLHGIPRISPNAIRRQRLLEMLGNGAPLVVVRGPAGSGKTTLVAQWLRENPPVGTTAWTTRDSTVGSRSAFWLEVLRALGRYELVDAERVEQDAELFADPASLRRALRSAFARITEPLTLVLENFGPPGAQWDEICADALLLLEEHEPLRIIAIGRAPSDFERVATAITVETIILDDDAVRLSPEEARQIIAATGLEPIPETDLADLLASTANLVFPFRYAIESIARNRKGWPTSPGGWLDVIGADILRRLEEQGTLAFAGLVALSPYVTVGFANELTGRGDGQQLLESLDHSGVGMWTIDARGEAIFRLTADAAAVLADAATKRTPERVAEARSKIAAWLFERGARIAGLEQAFRAGDLALADQLVTRAFFELQQTSSAPIVELILRTDPAQVRRYPALSMFAGIALRGRAEFQREAGSYFSAVAQASRARAKSAAPRERFVLSAFETTALRLVEQPGPAFRAAQQVLEADERLAHEDRLALGALYPTLLGHAGLTALVAERPGVARELAQREAEWSSRQGFPAQRNAAEGLRALVEVRGGHMLAARAALSRIRDEEWPTSWRDGYNGSAAAIARTMLAVNDGDTEQALAELVPLEARFATSEHWNLILAAKSLAIAIGGSPAEAEELFGRTLASRRTLGGRPVRDEGGLYTVYEMLGVFRRTSSSEMPPPELESHQRPPWLAVAALRSALSGRAVQAVEPLARVVSRGVPLQEMLATIDGVVLARRAAPVAAVDGFANRLAALVSLEGLRWPLALLPEVDRAAVLAAVDGANSREALADAFARIPALAADMRRAIELSARERAVLGELVTTGSRAEIAARLFVSVNTVKTQLRSLYQKLGASDRDAALLRAVELGLVQGEAGGESEAV